MNSYIYTGQKLGAVLMKIDRLSTIWIHIIQIKGSQNQSTVTVNVEGQTEQDRKRLVSIYP